MNFIADYGNSDSEDDTDPCSAAGVSTKRPLDNQSDRPLKKPARLPTPFAIQNPTTEHEDLPALHENRIRSFPHERGNWASFVHLPWNVSQRLTRGIESILLCCKENDVDLTLCDDFHISLSRTVILRHHWIEGFTSSVRKQIENVTSFPLYLQDVAVFVNEEQTRTFLAFNVHDISNTLDLLVQRLNFSLQEYQLPTFYENPKHHLSFAWCVGNKKKELDRIITNYNHCHMVMEGDCCQSSEVVAKIGNMKFSYPLKNT